MSHPGTERRGMAYAIAHAVTLVLLVVAGLINLFLGVVLFPRSVWLGLGFVTVSAVLLAGLWRASRVAVGLGAAGLALGPMAAQAAGAQTEGFSHSTALLGTALLYAIWLLTYAHRPQARRSAG